MIEIARKADLTRLCRVENMSGVTFTGENGGHKFTITAMRGDTKVTLTGSVTGRFIRPDGTGVQLTQSYAGIDSEGNAWVVLPANCYTMAGPFGLVITYIESGTRTVIYSCTGYVRPGETSTVVDPENIINVDAILGIIDDCERATTAATIASATAISAAAAAVTNFAGAYVSGTAYKAGDYITNGGNFYRVTADITAVENTEINDVSKVQVTVGRELVDVKDALDTHSKVLSLSGAGIGIDVTQLTSNYAVLYADGTIASSNSGYDATGYIDVSGFTSISYKRIKQTTSGGSVGIAFYDSTKTFIADSGIPLLKSQSAKGYADATAAVPEGAVYVRCTAWHSVATYGAFSISGVSKLSGLVTKVGEIDPLKAQVDGIKEVTDHAAIVKPVNRCNPAKIVVGKKLKSDGTLEDSGNNTTGFIAVKPGDSVIMYRNDSGGVNSIQRIMTAAYQTDKTTVVDYSGSSTTSAYTVPSGAAYVRFTFDSTYSEPMVVIGTTDTFSSYFPPYVVADSDFLTAETAGIVKNLPMRGKTIVNFGDSIFGKFRSEVRGSSSESISHMVAMLTGATCKNVAFAGTHAKTIGGRAINVMSFQSLVTAIISEDWDAQNAYADTLEDDAVAYKARITELANIDFSTVDVITVAYGTNDFSSQVTPADFETALTDGITRMMTAFPNLLCVICTPIIRFINSGGDPDADAEESGGDGGGSGSVISSDDYEAGTSHAKLTQFAQKCEDVGKALHCPVCENYWSLGINTMNYTTFMGGTGPSDKVHPNAKGRKLIANHLAAELNRL